MKTFLKDPGETLDYKFDFASSSNGTGDSDWLGYTNSPQEILASHTISTDSPGLSVVSSKLTDLSTSVTVWLSGGTAGNTYKVTCTAYSNNSPQRKAERTIKIKVAQR